MSAFTGYLIRQKRLEQNLSQEGLARGICAASYLSKIEQGLVEPGQEIIDRLFSALGVEFVRDTALEAEAERQLESFFFHWEAETSCESERAFLDAHADQLLRSEFALSYGVYRVCCLCDEERLEEARAALNRLEMFSACLSAPLRKRMLLAKATLAPTPEAALQTLEEASALGINCLIAYAQARRLSQLGRYGYSTEMAEHAFSLACREGNPFIMIWSSFLQGVNACNHFDLELAKRCFDRSIALTRGYRTDVTACAYYNLGSTYLEIGDMEAAFRYLRWTEEAGGEADQGLLLHQKLALLYAARGEFEEAARHIEQAWSYIKAEQSEAHRALYERMLRFPELLLGEAPMEQPEYERVLVALYKEAGEAFGHGFRQFYGRYLIELYTHQRRYKEALRVSEDMQMPILS